jgi:hypothetical protein
MTPVILPPGGPAATPAISSASHPAVLATVPDAPPAAARLEAGSIVTGTVIGRDAQGLVTLRTDKGVLALATNANLPVGSTVALEVRVAGARLQVVVLSVELPPGQTPGPTGQPIPSTGAPPATTPTPPQTPAAVLAAALTGGSLVMATVVHATAGRPGTPLGGPAPTSPGGSLPGQTGGATPAQAPASLPGGPASAGHPTAQLPGSQLSTGQLPGGQLPGGPAPLGPVPAGSLPGAAPPAPAPGAVPSAAGAVPGQPITQSTVQPAIAALLTAAAALEAELSALVAGKPIGGATGLMPTSVSVDGTHPALPAAGTAAQPQAALPQGAPPQTALLQGSSPQPALPQGSLRQTSLPVGAEVGVRILGAALPGQPAPTADARPAGAPPLSTGIVIGQTPSGHPIVDTEAGRLVLAMKAPLPPGTTLLLEIPPQGLPKEAVPGTVSTPQQALLRLSQGWPALGNALAALGAANDPAAAQALAGKLPQSGPGLAAGLMTMIGQLASGEAAEWLGPALREALERIGRRELGDRLRGEFQQLSRLASEPASGDWRVMFLPLRHEGELHQINLYLRGRRKGAKDGPDTGTRFIVEVDMTRLGPIQLDGLVHGRRFDLMLRSRVPLTPTMRRDIEAIFDEARGLTGFAGTIGFQIAASFPVQPLAQAKRKSAAGGVVV